MTQPPASKVPAHTIERLALIRSVARAAADQLTRPWPSSASALLLYHDAVEWCLLLCCQHLGASPKAEKFQFAEYFNQAKAAGGKELPQKIAMLQLNAARNALKHAGVVPGQPDLARLRVLSEEFLAQATEQVFALSFSDISLLGLVRWSGMRERLSAAQDALASGDPKGALERVAEQSHSLFMDYHRRREEAIGSWGHGVPSMYFSGWPYTHWMGHHGFGGSDAGNLVSQLAKDVNLALSELSGEVLVLSLGLDSARFHRFRVLTPQLTPVWDGKGTVHVDWPERTPAPTEQSAHFCLDFAIDCTLRLQDAAAAQGLGDVSLPVPDAAPPAEQAK